MKPWTFLPLTTLLLMGCRHKTEDTALPPPLVRVVKVNGGGTGALEIRGSVAPEGRLKLGFRKGGIVNAIKVREGDAVRVGQLLAIQEEAEWQAGVAAARAGLEKAKRDLARAERLASEGALPTSVAEDARTALAAAEAQKVGAEEGLAKLRLTAPVSGTIFQRLAEPGEAVGDGQPVLILDTTGDLLVKGGLTESEARLLRVGQPVTLLPESGISFPGRVRTVGLAPNPGDGSYALEVVPSGMADLRSGALLRIRVEGLKSEPGRRVPVEALVHRQDHTYVCVVEGGAIVQRPVTVLRVEGRTALLKDGLKDGDRVVAEGGAFLQAGQKVRVQE